MLSLQSNHIYIRKATTMNNKTLRKSPVVIGLYVCAALLLIYAIVQAGGSIKYVVSYYSQYEMTPNFAETAGYVLSSVYQQIVLAVLLAAAGYILNEVRALNPAYYATKEELEAAKAAKKAAKTVKTEDTVEVEEQAEDEEKAKLTINVEEAESDATVVFESVEATSGDEQEEALKEAKDQL